MVFSGPKHRLEFKLGGSLLADDLGQCPTNGLAGCGDGERGVFRDLMREHSCFTIASTKLEQALLAALQDCGADRSRRLLPATEFTSFFRAKLSGCVLYRKPKAIYDSYSSQPSLFWANQ